MAQSTPAAALVSSGALQAALDVAMEAVAQLLPPGTSAGAAAAPDYVLGGADTVRGSLAALAQVALQQTGNTSAPVALNFVPPAASAPSFCGPALAMSAAPLPALGGGGGGDFSLPLTRALPPCAGASTPGAAGPITLPPAIVAAQPPPSVAVSRPLLVELASRGAAYAGASLSVVQWGVSPVSETAGLGLIRYKPLVKPNTLAAEADAVMANATAAGGNIGRRLGLISSLFASLQSLSRGRSGGSSLSPTGATVAANAALRAAAPRPTVAYDRLPSRPLDSRVVSVTLTSRAGALLPVAGLAAPFLITIPLRDLSIMQWDPTVGATTGVGVGNAAFLPRVVNVTCPSSLAAARAGVSAFYTAPPALKGARAVVTLANAPSLAFSSATNAVQEGLSADVGFGGDAVGGGGSLGGGGVAPVPGAAPTRAGATSYLLTTDCGAPFGNSSFMCGPGSEGTRVAFSCPTVNTTPVCLWFDTGAGRWSIDGCEVANVTETSITCACNHLTDFAVRFAALDLPDNDLFAADAPTRVVLPPDTAVLMLSVASVLCLATLCACCYAARAESPRRVAYAARVAADAEVAQLARALAVGGVGTLSELAVGVGGSGGAQRTRAGRKVAPAPAAGGDGNGDGAAPLLAELLRRPLRRGGSCSGGDGAVPELLDLALLLVAPLDPLRVALAVEECGGSGGSGGNGVGAGAGAGAGARGGAYRALLTAQRHFAQSHVPAARALWCELSFGAGSHPCRSWLCGYDPRAPAPLRALAVGAALAASLYASCGWYAKFYGGGGVQLPPLVGAHFLAVAGVAACALAAFHAALTAVLVRPGGAAGWASGFPVLAAEEARRQGAGGALGARSSGALLRGVAAAVEARRGGAARPVLSGAALPSLRAAVEAGRLPVGAARAAAQLRALLAAEGGGGGGVAGPAVPTTLARVRGGAQGAARAHPPPSMPTPAEVRAAWEEEEGVPPRPPRWCVRHCGRLLRAWGAHPEPLEEAYKAWVGEVRGSAWQGEDPLEQEEEEPEADVEERLRGGWEDVLRAGGAGGSEDEGGRREGVGGGGGGGEGEGEGNSPRRLTLSPARAHESVRGSWCSFSRATLALLFSLGFATYFAVSFGLQRGDAASRSLLVAWIAGVATAALVVHPAATAVAVAWHVFLWPRLAPALAPVPLLGAACGAAATAAELRAETLPPEDAVAGRLVLLLRGFGAAAAVGAAPETTVVTAVGLAGVGRALHGRAHWAAVEERGRALRGALLAARAGTPALLAAAGGDPPPQLPPPPSAPPPPPPLPIPPPQQPALLPPAPPLAESLALPPQPQSAPQQAPRPLAAPCAPRPALLFLPQRLLPSALTRDTLDGHLAAAAPPSRARPARMLFFSSLPARGLSSARLGAPGQPASLTENF
jgi:hypothetical protein